MNYKFDRKIFDDFLQQNLISKREISKCGNWEIVGDVERIKNSYWPVTR